MICDFTSFFIKYLSISRVFISQEYFGEVAEEHDDDYSSYTTDEDLLEELLENELDISKIKQKSNTVVPYAERIKVYIHIISFG